MAEITFAPEIKVALLEIFAGECCSVCGNQAERYVKRKFYCGDCLPQQYSNRSLPMTAPMVKVLFRRYSKRPTKTKSSYDPDNQDEAW